MTGDFKTGMRKLAASVGKCVPMLQVPDVAAALDWYTSIGFNELGRNTNGDIVDWGMLSFGKAQIMLNARGAKGPQNTSLWFYTDSVEPLYELLKARKFESGSVDFVTYLYTPAYGGREFSIRDPNGYSLVFLQPGN